MTGKTELLAPAGSPEAVLAAVANGADAVYLGFGDYNARRMAKNFTEQELATAVKFCRSHGVKTYVTLNTLLTDRELLEVEGVCRTVNRLGVDAVIVADLGLARLLRDVAPELPMHASTQLTVHDLDGVLFLAERGFSRVVLARELNGAEIAYICENSPIEIEVFAHGALCMCYSGQCEFSAVIGRRSGNRGMCAQPCRMAYTLNERVRSAYPLSLKDLCLAEYVGELSDMGVACLKLEGRMKRPEYVAIVTDIYARLLRERRKPTADELSRLELAFSRQGFTDGYYTGQKGTHMFGVRPEGETAPDELFRAARETYRTDTRACGVTFYCVIDGKKPSVLAAEDDRGNRHIAKGQIPEAAISRPLTEDAVRGQLEKTGGTAFYMRDAHIKLSDNLSLPASAINALRRECLDALAEKAAETKKRREGKFNVGFKLLNTAEPPELTVSVLSLGQLSDELLSRKPKIIYIPLTEAVTDEARLTALCQEARVCVSFPRIIKDGEREEIARLSERALACGVREASVGNTGHIAFAKGLGFSVRADYGISVFNSHTLRELRRAGLTSALLSPELTFPQLRDMAKSIDTELIVYGRLPLMITENCVVHTTTGACVCKNSHTLSDRTGAAFPLLGEFGHRSVILNSQKIFLADKKKDFLRLGITYMRLFFTTENARECVSVTDAYLGRGDYAPSAYTRGLYYRGVE